MNQFCKSLREHVMNTINFKKKKNEVINKLETIVIIQVNIEVLRIAYVI